MSTHLELFLELLKILPNDFARDMSLITFLDQKVEDTISSMDPLATKILNHASQRRLSQEEQVEMLQLLQEKRISELHAYDLTKEKIAIVQEMKGVIRSFISKIDEDLVKFERELEPDVIQSVIEEDESLARQEAMQRDGVVHSYHHSSMHPSMNMMMGASSSLHGSLHGSNAYHAGAGNPNSNPYQSSQALKSNTTAAAGGNYSSGPFGANQPYSNMAANPNIMMNSSQAGASAMRKSLKMGVASSLPHNQSAQMPQSMGGNPGVNQGMYNPMQGNPQAMSMSGNMMNQSQMAMQGKMTGHLSQQRGATNTGAGGSRNAGQIYNDPRASQAAGGRVDARSTGRDARGGTQRAATNIPRYEPVVEPEPADKVYCICKGMHVADDTMIGCENEECPYEWFHLHCVNLKKAPEGDWWCDYCVEKGYNKR